MDHASESEDAVCCNDEKECRYKRPDPPAWLSRDFIQNCLTRSKNYNECAFISFGVDYACSSSHTFSSNLFRVYLTLKDKKNSEIILSLIVKCIPDDTSQDFLPGLIEGFKKEILVYSKIMDEVNSLLESVGYFDSATVQWFGSGEVPTYFLLIEDLLPSSYQMAKKQEGLLGLQDSLLVMRLIAKYHAATAVILEKNSNVADDFKGCTRYVRGNDRGIRKIFSLIIPIIMDSLTKRANIPPHLIAQIKNVGESLPDKIEILTQYKSNRFNVILHGDLWINNLMFRYLNGEIKDVKFIDFQESFVSSPVYDLLFYIHTSLEEEVELTSFQLLIDEYYKTLSETLKMLQYEGLPYSMEDLRNDIEEYEEIHMFASIFVSGVTLANEDISDYFEGTSRGHVEFFGSVYSNPIYLSKLERKLLFFAEKGIL